MDFGKGLGFLEDHPDAVAHLHRVHVCGVEVLPVEEHLALGMRCAGTQFVHAVEGAQQGDFAAAGRTDDGGDLIALDLR